MGFLGEFRKLLFGVKSVSKSGAKKVADKSKDIGEDILDTGQDAFETGKEKLGDIGEKVVDGLGDLKEKAKDFTSDITESLSKNETVKKAGDFTEKVGAEVIEKGGEMMEKAGEISEKVGEKVLKAKDRLMEEAEKVGEKLKDKYDETYEKALELEKEEALEGDSEFADTPLDAGGSLIEDTDDFFSRAEKFAKGDYTGKQDNVRVNTPVELPKEDIEIIKEEGDVTISKLPSPDKKKLADAAGFKDLDGDGNELVDDAIIEEE